MKKYIIYFCTFDKEYCKANIAAHSEQEAINIIHNNHWDFNKIIEIKY